MESFSYIKTHGLKTDHWQRVWHLFETINSIFILCMSSFSTQTVCRIQATFIE